MEILDTVYNILSSDADLSAMLAGLYHQHAPGGDRARYPYIVYSQVSDAPALNYDNAERERRITIRVHIVAREGQYAAIYARILEIMKGAGFMRRYTNDIYSDGDFIRIVDFVITDRSD